MTQSNRTEQKDPDCPPERPAIALVGNMNVGKTTLFSRLCGTDTKNINFPGTTVSIPRGRIKGSCWDAIDTPGTCSIFSENEDEIVSREVLMSFGREGEIVGAILVADAKNLKRSVALALQYAEYGVPMLLDVNMTDEATSRGIVTDFAKLSDILGIEVRMTVANAGFGVNSVKTGLDSLRIPPKQISYPAEVEEFLTVSARHLHSSPVSARLLGLLILAGDKRASEYVSKTFGSGMIEYLGELAAAYRQQTHADFSVLLTHIYNKKAEQIVQKVQHVESQETYPFLEKFGNWSMDIRTGIPISFGILYLMYLFVGAFGASFIVDSLDQYLFAGFLVPWSTKLAGYIPIHFLRDMIIDPDFGILPTGVFLVVGLVFPVLLCFNIFFGMLEDSGYLPRLSVLLNKVFEKIGLNGKGVMPIIMGFSCITMAMLTTRVLDSKKEKIIATILLLLGIPCSPLLAVMLTILVDLPLSASITVFGLIFLQTMVAGFLAGKIIPGQSSPFIMEIPPMRLPKIQPIIVRSFRRTMAFMKEAIPVFILAALLVFITDRLGGLDLLERIARPLINGVIGLPEKSIQVFIKTIIRKESGAAELVHLKDSFQPLQLVVTTYLIAFLIPCLNAAMVVFKERGIKTATAIIGGVMLYALSAGAVLNHVCRLMGITFS